MKKATSLFLVLSLAILPLFTSSPQKVSNKQLQKWINSKTWMPKGLGIALHHSVNKSEFYSQYQLNKEAWDTAFKFLAENDLGNLPNEKRELIAGKCIVTISEYEPKDTAKQIIEQHKKFIDLQYVVRGEEAMGFANPKSAVVKVPYREDRDVAVIASSDVTFYKATPKELFLFFPSDLHQPSVKTKDSKPGDKSKKIVFKISYVE